MPRRNSPDAVEALDDLSQLGELVYDKRNGQRSAAKKNRRNRHYEKLFIRHALARQGLKDAGDDAGDAATDGVTDPLRADATSQQLIR